MQIDETIAYERRTYEIQQFGGILRIRPFRNLGDPRVERTLRRWFVRSLPGLVVGPISAKPADRYPLEPDGATDWVGNRHRPRVWMGFYCLGVRNPAPEDREQVADLLTRRAWDSYSRRIEVLRFSPDKVRIPHAG